MINRVNIELEKYIGKIIEELIQFGDIDKSFKAIRPYFDYMSDVLTTNLNGESII